MIKKLLLAMLCILPLSANQDTQESKIETKIEIGMYSPSIGGNIVNAQSSASFEDDFGYSDAKASYFALGVVLNYEYVPNVELSYFMMEETAYATLNRSINVADGTFSSNTSSQINYSSLNAVIYQDFKIKGKLISTEGTKPLYTGDIEFDIGINTKLIDYTFSVSDSSTGNTSWIEVKQFIPLPYVGMKYYFYDLIAYANISALSLSDAKSSNYQVGLDYRIVAGLYVSASYLYEKFEVVEKLDTINFETSGYKLSFKYAF